MSLSPFLTGVGVANWGTNNGSRRPHQFLPVLCRGALPPPGADGAALLDLPSLRDRATTEGQTPLSSVWRVLQPRVVWVTVGRRVGVQQCLTPGRSPSLPAVTAPGNLACSTSGCRESHDVDADVSSTGPTGPPHSPLLSKVLPPGCWGRKGSPPEEIKPGSMVPMTN